MNTFWCTVILLTTGGPVQYLFLSTHSFIVGRAHFSCSVSELGLHDSPTGVVPKTVSFSYITLRDHSLKFKFKISSRWWWKYIHVKYTEIGSTYLILRNLPVYLAICLYCSYVTCTFWIVKGKVTSKHLRNGSIWRTCVIDCGFILNLVIAVRLIN